MNKNNKPVRLKLAHINDTHSYFEPTSLQLDLDLDGRSLTPFVSAGGFARIATRVKQLRQQAIEDKQGFLFLHAGDCFQGTLYFSLFKGEANAVMLNALALDAMAIGNHELDMGNLPVAQFAQTIEFPLLAGNWDLSQERTDKPLTLRGNTSVIAYDAKQHHANWIEKDVDGESVAIFSLALDKMADISNPDPDTPFVNTLETAKATVAAIQAKGINKIILLSHMGYDSDIEMARQVDGIALIVGGHSHRLQGDFSQLGFKHDDEYGITINDTHVVQAGFHALTMGHCDIEFDAQGKVISFNGKNELLLGRRLFIDAKRDATYEDDDHQCAKQFVDQHPNVVVCKKDPQVKAILENNYVARVRELQKNIIANADSKMRHVRIPDEIGASQLAPLVAKSFVYSLNKRGGKIQFAIHNAGGVRNSLNAGPVSAADIAGKLLPFAVPIGSYRISGQDLALTLEGAINNAFNNGVDGTGDGSYPYTDGLDFEYDASANVGHRIKNLHIGNNIDGWSAVDPNAFYNGASSAYTMKGKEGYDAICNMDGEGEISQLSMADCFIDLLSDNPNILNELPIYKQQKWWHESC